MTYQAKGPHCWQLRCLLRWVMQTRWFFSSNLCALPPRPVSRTSPHCHSSLHTAWWNARQRTCRGQAAWCAARPRWSPAALPSVRAESRNSSCTINDSWRLRSAQKTHIFFPTRWTNFVDSLILLLFFGLILLIYHTCTQFYYRHDYFKCSVQCTGL